MLRGDTKRYAFHGTLVHIRQPCRCIWLESAEVLQSVNALQGQQASNWHSHRNSCCQVVLPGAVLCCGCLVLKLWWIQIGKSRNGNFKITWFARKVILFPLDAEISPSLSTASLVTLCESGADSHSPSCFSPCSTLESSTDKFQACSSCEPLSSDESVPMLFLLNQDRVPDHGTTSVPHVYSRNVQDLLE